MNSKVHLIVRFNSIIGEYIVLVITLGPSPWPTLQNKYKHMLCLWSDLLSHLSCLRMYNVVLWWLRKLSLIVIHAIHAIQQSSLLDGITGGF